MTGNRRYNPQIFLSVIIFSSIIISRIVLETVVFGENFYFHYYVLIHHFCWFSFVFLWFALAMKHVTGFPAKHIHWLVLISPIVYVPILYTVITGDLLHLDYISVRHSSLTDVLLAILTLNYTHGENNKQFLELLLLFLLVGGGAWVLTKNLKKTIWTLILGFYGSYIIAGIHWFGVNVEPRTSAVFLIPSSLKNHHAMSLIFYFLAVSALVVLSFPENKAFISKLFSGRQFGGSILLFLLWTIFFTTTFSSPTNRMVSLFDIIFSFFPVLVLLQSVLLWKHAETRQKHMISFISFVGISALLPMLFGVY